MVTTPDAFLVKLHATICCADQIAFYFDSGQSYKTSVFVVSYLSASFSPSFHVHDCVGYAK